MSTGKVKKLVEDLGNEQGRDELYGLLIDIGKRVELSAEQRNELKGTILQYCNHEDEQVRSAAIRVLCFYWGMSEFRDKAFEMFANDKEDEGTRSDALSAWANTYRNSNDAKVLELLIGVLKNETLPLIVRAGAYSSFFVVSSLQPKDWPDMDLDWDDFDNEVDWKLLDKILATAK